MACSSDGCHGNKSCQDGSDVPSMEDYPQLSKNSDALGIDRLELGSEGLAAVKICMKCKLQPAKVGLLPAAFHVS